MGSLIEINDTLRIAKEQGFPAELDINKHLNQPYKAEDFKGKVFDFKAKPKIRIYHAPPVRNLLVEDIDGKWLYWGLCNILEVRHDYVKKETSGKFEIIHINSPEEMKKAFELVDREWPNNYFDRSI